MTYFDNSTQRSVPLGSVSFFAFVTVFERALHRLQEQRARRRTIDELSRLDDAQLRDIGVTRNDILDLRDAL